MTHEEATHRSLCRSAAGWLLNQRWTALVAWEIAGPGGVFDAVGVSGLQAKKARLAVIEVKRTRPDLLGDLKRQKLLNYEQGATQVYLAGTHEALALDIAGRGSPGRSEQARVIADLGARGLPEHWGILLLLPHYGGGEEAIASKLRRAKPLKPFHEPNPAAWQEKIAASFMWRTLKHSGPMSEGERYRHSLRRRALVRCAAALNSTLIAKPEGVAQAEWAEALREAWDVLGQEPEGWGPEKTGNGTEAAPVVDAQANGAEDKKDSP